MIDIQKGELLEGKLPRRALNLVLDWVELHKAELLEDWLLMEQKQHPKPIARWSNAMHWDVTDVKVKEDYTLWVRFKDGVQGTVKFLPTFFSGVFAHLIDPTQFRQVSNVDGVVTWPGELDIAPDAMHDEIQAKGEWILS